jgi:hypothetical protein
MSKCLNDLLNYLISMLDKDRLCEFLVEAKKSTYAAGSSSPEKSEKDFSTTLTFRD